MIKAAPTTEAPCENLLRRFLSDHDAPCPACGYNLRGAGSRHCPECGRGLELELAIHEPGHLWRRHGLLLLIFAWLLIAGAINATRAGRHIYDTVNSPAQVWFTSRTNGTRLYLSQPTPSMPLSITSLPPGRVTGPTGQRPVVAVGPTSLAQPAPPLSTQWSFPGPAPRSNWSSVGWIDWTRLGAWSLLALGAAGALVVVVRYRRRPASRRVARSLMLVAWLGFGGYFAYHLVTFAREWG